MGTSNISCSLRFILAWLFFTLNATLIYGCLFDSVNHTLVNCSFNSTVLSSVQKERGGSLSSVKKVLTVVPASDVMHQFQILRMQRQARKTCSCINSTYNEDSGHCVRIKLLDNGTSVCEASRPYGYMFVFDITTKESTEYWLYITGNTWSLASTVILLTTYVMDKELHTSYGRCIVLLSINTMLQQVMQILSLNAKGNLGYCTAIAVLHHWSYLVMFLWMSSIAFDLATTFSHLRTPSKEVQQRRFRIYALISEAIPTAVVLLCIAIDFSSNNVYIGYGEDNICFITNYLANILVFSLPVGSMIIFNIISLGVALIFIVKTRQNSRLGLRASRRKPHMTIVIMTLKLSSLLGIGWVFGPIANLTHDNSVLYIYVFFNTFQGFFIFFAFCANQKVLRFYKQAIRVALVRLASLQNTNHIQETSL